MIFMKTIKKIFALICTSALMAVVLTGCGQSVKAIDQKPESALGGESKVLVVYFSYSGNTQTVARSIQEEIGGDIFRVTVTDEYPNSYNEMSDRTEKEKSEQARPELKDSIDEATWEAYDTVFLGYPIWWGDMPMPMYTFLESYDFTGKTVYPFVTSDSSGFSGTISKIQSAASGATVIDNGLSITAGKISSAETSVNSWVEEIGLSNEE